MRIGILSDTHGLLRPRVLELLAGCQRILHAGDVGDPAILKRLAALAPVTAVRGNMDAGRELLGLPDSVRGELGEVAFGMVHRREDVPRTWLKETRLILFGHSHRPELEWQGGCLLLNPGACGQHRFRLPLTVARVQLLPDGRFAPEILSVEDETST
jgi:putative phosphoesterase